MCVAVPVEVIEVRDNDAVVNFGGVKKKINIDLVYDLKVGDYVLLHAGCAMQKIDKEEAEKTLEIFKELAKEN
ncbi:HypC/HybG/HupF family hydrogenase formation chaperone [Oceanirhabdus sp. W0125-5]|uniref:HypC/HybG/HupF family hydrogenase formation chaperone n=1 Tax=Oceanirhabdus sp. W0125-5 TaxID=2999116 RepID=UPI0022F302D8|nr:HypC/HybG/HupF family hydrogenase formation chaperone [Oceanirhabdus sp. W0125-5]WBW95808.1 HypC/HybG/HupF family hydrogenase formation chaperone [Oceanirhabdus sp. W0125-5]